MSAAVPKVLMFITGVGTILIWVYFDTLSETHCSCGQFEKHLIERIQADTARNLSLSTTSFKETVSTFNGSKSYKTLSNHSHLDSAASLISQLKELQQLFNQSKMLLQTLNQSQTVINSSVSKVEELKLSTNQSKIIKLSTNQSEVPKISTNQSKEPKPSTIQSEVLKLSTNQSKEPKLSTNQSKEPKLSTNQSEVLIQELTKLQNSSDPKTSKSRDEGLALNKANITARPHGSPLMEHTETSKLNQTANKTSNQFHVLTMLQLFNGELPPHYSTFDKEALNRRDDEYLDTIATNLAHPLVKNLHLFYVNTSNLKTLLTRNSSQSEKLVFVKMDRALHMSDFFTYSSKNLVDQPVIAMNGDIILGDGFDSIDTQRLRDEKVMYSLSRYEREKPTQTCHKKNMVLAKGYQFSHDTHVFRLAEPLNETLILDKLDYPINMWGAENAMIYTFKFDLHFTVRNPCLVLTTYHKHCSGVHGPVKKNIDKHEYSIYYLDKGWTKDKVLLSSTSFEKQLDYGN